MKRFVILVLTLAVSMLIISPANAVAFGQRPEVTQFINDVAKQHNIDKKSIIRALNQIESSPEIIQKITTPYEAMSWNKYQKFFVAPQRISDGVKFWLEHAPNLQKAENQYGVPAHMIVAIIGVESSYGQHRGKYPVLQALATLAFDHPPRAPFFKNELKEYLLLITEQRLDPLQLKGSYAGAMGTPQFIASSYRNFAVDFDGSGQIDLINNVPQAIGSVANYFKVHGWKAGATVAHKATIKGDKYQAIPIAAGKNPKPAMPLAFLKKHGITPAAPHHDPDEHVAFVEFDQGTHKEYWLGFNNFYVITRYNHSSNYALAVHQLSQEIATQYKKQDKPNGKN